MTVILRESGASSTLRPFRFPHWRLGILDRPLSRAMTAGVRSAFARDEWPRIQFSNSQKTIQFVEPSLRANGSRECAPDDRLREAMHLAAKKVWIASSLRSSQ